MESEGKKISRRDFMKHSSLGTIGLAAGINTLAACSTITLKDGYRTMSNMLFGTEDPVPEGVTPIEPIANDIHSTLSIVYSPNAVQDSGKINQTIVQMMFDKAIYTYTGKKSLEEAWDEIIPGLKSTDIVGLKINCINPSLPTSPEVVTAIITHLVKVGVSENNIIVWDRDDSIIMGVGSITNSGFEINSGDQGVRYICTSSENIGYDDDSIIRVPSIELSFPVSKIISKECNYLINVPQLRHHAKAGISQCMKNYYGVIPLFDTFAIGTAAQMHMNNCNPAIPELYNNSIFKEKTKLHVCDALLTMYEGGPLGYPQEVIGKLMIGRDPVALDYMGLMIIEEQRKKREIGTLMRRAKYIQTAAEMGIGTNNPQQMDVKEIEI